MLQKLVSHFIFVPPTSTDLTSFEHVQWSHITVILAGLFSDVIYTNSNVTGIWGGGSIKFLKGTNLHYFVVFDQINGKGAPALRPNQ